MLTKHELLRWLNTIEDNQGIYINDSGLTLCSECGAYMDVGGEPEGEDEDE